jgi:hypothetical protein
MLTRCLFDPGSEMEKIRTRDKHLGSAALMISRQDARTDAFRSSYEELVSYPVVLLVGDLLAIPALEGHVRVHVPGDAVNPDIVNSFSLVINQR